MFAKYVRYYQIIKVYFMNRCYIFKINPGSEFKKCYICLHETGNIRLEHDSLCRGMEPADGMV